MVVLCGPKNASQWIYYVPALLFPLPTDGRPSEASPLV